MEIGLYPKYSQNHISISAVLICTLIQNSLESKDFHWVMFVRIKLDPPVPCFTERLTTPTALNPPRRSEQAQPALVLTSPPEVEVAGMLSGSVSDDSRHFRLAFGHCRRRRERIAGLHIKELRDCVHCSCFFQIDDYSRFCWSRITRGIAQRQHFNGCASEFRRKHIEPRELRLPCSASSPSQLPAFPLRTFFSNKETKLKIQSLSVCPIPGFFAPETLCEMCNLVSFKNLVATLRLSLHFLMQFTTGSWCVWLRLPFSV